jgi:hypothetical protein
MRLRLPVKHRTEDVTHICVEVDYQKGGRNYLTGGCSPRGIFVCVRPVAIEDGVERWVLFDGAKDLLEETSRMSAKKVAAWSEQVGQQIAAKSGKAWDLVQRICASKRVELGDTHE